MDTTVLVDVGGQEFNGPRDSNGVEWSVASIGGWEGGGADLATEGMAGADGDAVGRHRLRGRSLVVAGTVSTPPEQHWAAFYTLTAVVNNLTARRDLVVHEPDGAKVVRYIRGGQPRIRQEAARVIEFELPLLCPDPRKYLLNPRTSTLGAGQSAPINNLGTYPGGAPVRVVTTTAGAVDITLESGRFRTRAGESLPAGAVIDPLTRTVKSPAGADLFDRVAPNFTWPYASATLDGRAFRNGSAGAIDLTILDAWL